MKSIYPKWKRKSIHLAAKVLGVLVHIEGLPYGCNKAYLSKCGAVSTGDTISSRNPE